MTGAPLLSPTRQITEANQFFIAYQSPRQFRAKPGRQEINYGDEHFVGSVSFRRNQQSFDTVTLGYSNNEDGTLNYAHVANVNRTFGDNSDNEPTGLLVDHQQDTHLLNVVYSGWAIRELEA